jgi:hypothetical protein
MQKEMKKNVVAPVGQMIDRQWQKIVDNMDLMLSHFINIQECKSVCLALGPYRNLTTLTAATLFLHPNCQVLNHGGTRIFGNSRVDFLSNYSEETFNRFIQYAIRISTKGKRGDYGGSITYSHAFDLEYPMKEAYTNSNVTILKEKITCLFWKESLTTSNLIRKRNVDLRNILEKEERLRFLLPIRNPLDCAISNLRSGHASRFENINARSSEIEVSKAVLDEILWFAELHSQYPGRFFYFFEHEISREMLINLATFLQIDPSEIWINNALSVMKTRKSYQHDVNLVAFYREYANSRFARFPALLEGLLLFVQNDGNKLIKASGHT